MSDIKLNCPHCEQSLDIPSELLGQTVECPSCQGSIALPKPEPQPKAETKDCPYCGELILAKAKKCKHCGELLDAALKKQRRKRSHSSRPALKSRSRTAAQTQVIVKPRGEGCFLQTLNVGCVIIFIIIAIIVIIVIAAMNA